jgi:hypothetical protein
MMRSEWLMTTETRVPLLPESGLFARVDDPDAAGRFVRLFGTVFTQIPDPARTVLLEYWRERRELVHRACRRHSTGPVEVELPVWPVFTLSNHWNERIPGSLSDCDPCGEVLAFHLGAFRLMPDGVVAILIARELCRALFVAEEKDFPSTAAEEQEVNRTLESWGFETQILTDWAQNARGALREAGVDRCGWCGERDVPEEQPPQLEGPSGWEPVCSECFAEHEGRRAV